MSCYLSLISDERGKKQEDFWSLRYGKNTIYSILYQNAYNILCYTLFSAKSSEMDKLIIDC